MKMHDDIEYDQLALGLTRPPMFMGVSMKLFFGNVMMCALICLNAHTMWGVLLFVALHLIAVRLSIKEPNFLYLRVMSFFKTPPVMNFWYWGRVNSYQPW